MLTKSTVAPIVSVICLGVASIFHKEIPADIQDSIVTLIVLGAAVVTSIWGIFKNHSQQPPEDPKA